MSKLAWLVFEKGTDIDAALKALDGMEIGETIIRLAVNNKLPQRTRLLTNEFLAKPRLEHDLAQIKELATMLDSECMFKLEESASAILSQRLDNHILPSLSQINEDDTLQIRRSLDLHIEYLNSVHNYDYYSGVESFSPEEHYRYFFP